MKVLFIDSVHPILWTRLTEANFYCIDGTTFSKTQILDQITKVDGIVIRSKYTTDKSIIDTARQLKFIARSGSGLENIDVNYAKSRGIEVFNSPEGNRDAVAEHVIAMLLSLFNNINQGHQEVLEGNWNREKNRGVELKGKTIAIIGYGFMGKAWAKRLVGFGCQVMCYDKYLSDYGDQNARQSSYEEIFEKADIVSFHVPLNESTHMLCSAEYLQKFRKNIYVVNTSRGKVLDTKALLSALRSGKVKGACLDVIEYETSSFETVDDDLEEVLQFFRNQNNVVLSPHVAGWTTESYEKLSSVLADKILERF